MKQLLFGLHPPVMGFSSRSSNISNNDHIVFRTNWLDALSTLSAVVAVTN
jgi:hypothetical protein